jgi:hypothetical protein
MYAFRSMWFAPGAVLVLEYHALTGKARNAVTERMTFPRALPWAEECNAFGVKNRVFTLKG